MLQNRGEDQSPGSRVILRVPQISAGLMAYSSAHQNLSVC